MNTDITQLLRENIRKIQPYSSARDEFTGDAKVFLDANENPFGSVGGEKYNRYPDPYQNELKKKLGQYKKINPENIFLGNGSDEAIDLIFRVFGEPKKDKVVLMPPTYGMYKVSADINDIEIVNVPLLKGFRMDVDNVLKLSKNAKLLFICSPNNPSANEMDYNDIKTIADNFEGITVIDEAYKDFSQEPSWAYKIDEYPRVIVLQTFSKAWGMAGIRLGVAYANKEIIRVMSKVKPPYNVNIVTQDIATKALDNTIAKDFYIDNLNSERDRLMKELPDIECITEVFPSNANFILSKTNKPKEIYNHLVANGIVVRDRSNQPLCEGCLRLTVGTAEENDKLLDCLRGFLVK